MFEKMLESIAKDQSAQKIRAFLWLVETLPTPEKKATAMAEFAEIRISQNVVEALKALQCGFRIDPKNGPLLMAAERIFKRLQRPDAAKRIAEYRSRLVPEGSEFGGLSEKTVEFLPGDKTTVAGVELSVASENAIEPQLASQVFEVAFASNEESVSLAFGSSVDKESTQAVRVKPDAPSAQCAQEMAPVELQLDDVLGGQKARHIALTFSDQKSEKYDIFSSFLKDSGLDFRLLELAEGFSDNALGLVHFVNFLREEKKIEGATLERAVATLKIFVLQPGTELRCRVRFFDLFEAQNGKS
jgi:hypothetical protein